MTMYFVEFCNRASIVIFTYIFVSSVLELNYVPLFLIPLTIVFICERLSRTWGESQKGYFIFLIVTFLSILLMFDLFHI